MGTLALVLLTPSCLRLLWGRTQIHWPVPESSHEDLCDPEATMTECLERLGAPLYVWEEPSDRVALAWGWHAGTEWGANLSIPLAQELSATLDYQDLNLDLNGLVLVFDGSNRLTEKRSGILADIAQEARRRRPSVVDDMKPSEE
ncbi:MAG: hypothetical protein ACI9F9_001411 [Candidatus Paceibacteria bacterium]|jgi:hypothetical protein